MYIIYYWKLQIDGLVWDLTQFLKFRAMKSKSKSEFFDIESKSDRFKSKS